MAEIKGYTCDGGCGATTVLDRPYEQVTRNGWLVCFRADARTLYACSPECMAVALVPWSVRALRR